MEMHEASATAAEAINNGRLIKNMPVLQVLEDFQRGLRFIQRVKMDPRSAALQKFAALLGRVIDPDAHDFFFVAAGGLQALQEFGRELRPAEAREAFDLVGVGDRHDPGDNRLVNAARANLVDEAEIIGVVKKKLGHDEVGALGGLLLK